MKTMPLLLGTTEASFIKNLPLLLKLRGEMKGVLIRATNHEVA